MKNKAYEWVVLCSDEEFYLTEKQHEFLLENQDKRFVDFGTFTINPAFTAWMKQRPADVIKDRYPCKKCNTNGVLHEREKDGNLKTCPDCNGTGLNL